MVPESAPLDPKCQHCDGTTTRTVRLVGEVEVMVWADTRCCYKLAIDCHPSRIVGESGQETIPTESLTDAVIAAYLVGRQAAELRECIREEPVEKKS